MKQALKDATVVDLTQAWAGPYATMLLADMGASVIDEWIAISIANDQE